MSDPLRDYLRVAFDYETDHYGSEYRRTWQAMSDEDRALVAEYGFRFDAHHTKNSGLLADITDAVYGKGTAEAKGYPRGLVAKVRRVFNILRARKRAGHIDLTSEALLLKEVE